MTIILPSCIVFNSVFGRITFRCARLLSYMTPISARPRKRIRMIIISKHVFLRGCDSWIISYFSTFVKCCKYVLYFSRLCDSCSARHRPVLLSIPRYSDWLLVMSVFPCSPAESVFVVSKRQFMCSFVLNVKLNKHLANLHVTITGSV